MWEKHESQYDVVLKGRDAEPDVRRILDTRRSGGRLVPGEEGSVEAHLNQMKQLFPEGSDTYEKLKRRKYDAALWILEYTRVNKEYLI